ncbi:hypothetical protein LPB136_00605 [Tenacibaculum todarodis]|uniref:ACB domain-containing protein n=1 Tax=Tenacibaculum todarodis TaxID=1850252 RepID=A0A1L3JFQ8_9FLAO|nr:acyl-CoA-binding protein [Tenacibaculum todarodis]APG63962.1 hypothetical protein LPB136_00605 [Tenacibaculum todarodis]
MIIPENLNTAFENAFEKVSKVRFEMAPDIRLQFYAYYKQATSGDNFAHNRESNVISAFKFNAWMQLKGMPAKEAKKAYIELANNVLTKNKNQ